MESNPIKSRKALAFFLMRATLLTVLCFGARQYGLVALNPDVFRPLRTSELMLFLFCAIPIFGYLSFNAGRWLASLFVLTIFVSGSLATNSPDIRLILGFFTVSVLASLGSVVSISVLVINANRKNQRMHENNL